MFRDIGPNDFARLHLLPGPDGRRGGPILLPGVAAGNPERRLHTRCQGSTSSRSPRRRRRLHPPPGVAAHPSGAWVRNGAAPTTIRCHLLPVPDQGTAARILLPRAAVFVSRRREGLGAKDFRKSLQFSSKKIGPTEQPGVGNDEPRGVRKARPATPRPGRRTGPRPSSSPPSRTRYRACHPRSPRSRRSRTSGGRPGRRG